MARVFLALSTYISSNGHRSNASLPVLIDWDGVVSIEMLEDPNTPISNGGPRMYTEVTLESGKTFKVCETPNEIWTWIEQTQNDSP